MRLLNRMITLTTESMILLMQCSSKDVTTSGATRSNARSALTEPLLNVTNSAFWKKTILIGGTVILGSYVGYKIWHHLNEKPSSKDLGGQDKLEADDQWCLSPGSQWSEIAGDSWAEGDVQYDPLYGLPPWVVRMEGENGETGTSDGDMLAADSDFCVPKGVRWADICPEDVGDVEVEDAYILHKEEKVAPVSGLYVIPEKEEEE